jgi:galactokinase
MVTSRFQDIFGAPPSVVAQAPGRVNLLGEHTDYNDGFVLPVAITQQTQVSLGFNSKENARFVLHADTLDQHVEFDLTTLPEPQFARYVYGCLRETQAQGELVPPMNIHVSSTVPMGVGLSSSAALEVAMLRGLRGLLGVPFDDVMVAKLAQRAEVEYAGVRCGILDQMASSLADTQRALFLDTKTLQRRLVPLPEGTAVLVLDSGVSRSLATSGYNTRRGECEAAAKALGVTSLRDLQSDDSRSADIDDLPSPLRQRVRHVLSENARVLRAVEGVSAKEFGALMRESHASQRDDYEVSVPAVDRLVQLLQSHPAVYGARLTGGGFGGACVALCEADALAEIGDAVLRDYRATGEQGRVLVPHETAAA